MGIRFGIYLFARVLKNAAHQPIPENSEIGARVSAAKQYLRKLPTSILSVDALV